MKHIIETFTCNLKQDTFHAVGDQGAYWTMRMAYSISDVALSLTGIESFLFYHGWTILLLWRCVNAGLDTYKRLRDVGKPEWESQVKPVLIQDAIRERKLSLWQKIKTFFKSTL
jgi:hypothetical protein